jgi:hypothetical protein
MPNADPCNIDLLRPKYPEPAHPDRDPVSLISRLWSRTQNLEEYWTSDTGTEFLDKWFSIPKIYQHFLTRSPVTMTDWWLSGVSLITPLFFNDNTGLFNLIRNRLILPHLTVSFHPSFIEECADGLLMSLQKQDGDIHSMSLFTILTMNSHCFASLTMKVTPVRNEVAKLFTSTYDNFIQTTGIRDGV